MIHVVYRYHAGENRKGRPWWYSKAGCLDSFVAAVRECPVPVEVTYLVDGDPPPVDVLDVMFTTGRVRWIRAGSARRSYRVMLRHAAGVDAAPDDVVWLAEDDYTYHPDALCTLVLQAAAAEYVSLYSPSGESVVSTTSTFGVRYGALVRDRWWLWVASWAPGAWDRATWLGLQGVPPYGRWWSGWSPKQAAAGAARAGIDLAARVMRSRVMTASRDPVIWHAETAESTGVVGEPGWVPAGI